MSRYPACPWRLPYGTSVAARLELGRDLARDAMQSLAVQAFAARIRSTCLNCSRVQLAERVLAAVQNVGWVLDASGDFMQPVEYTLAYGGDCEDLTNLMLAVLWLLGFQGMNHWVYRDKSEKWDHVTGYITLGPGEVPAFARMYPSNDNGPAPGSWWADTTVRGAYLGEYVDDAADRVQKAV